MRYVHIARDRFWIVFAEVQQAKAHSVGRVNVNYWKKKINLLVLMKYNMDATTEKSFLYIKTNFKHERSNQLETYL